MFPGMGNPKQMQGIMRQMGIKSEELKAERVIIESAGKKIVINNPQVTIIEMKGQKTFLIAGEPHEESPAISEEDLKLVMEQTGATKKKAEEALKSANGDIAEAITKLKK